MMKNTPSPFQTVLKDRRGSAMVIALLTLLIVTIIGISTINNAITEKNIATNDILHQQAFYEADGGTEMASELIEYNIDTVSGFPSVTGQTTVVFNDTGGNPLVYVEKTDNDDFAFWMNDSEGLSESLWQGANPDSDTDRDFYITTDNEDTRTNLRVGGDSELLAGSAIQMAAGYEGRGKALAAGGSYLLYEIYSQHIGRRNSKSTIMAGWRHVIGNEEAKE